MKRIEVLEIKKLFTPAECAIQRIVGMEFDPEGNCDNVINERFLQLDEMVMFKFFDIFKKALSGKIGKNLYNLEVLKNRCGSRDLLEEARYSHLEEENTWQVFMETIVENYKCSQQYIVLMIYGVYDIPGKAKDGTTMEDASDEVYRYLLTCICPMKLQNAGITINGAKMEAAERNWVVGMPMAAFMYPAFNDREEDHDHVWFYSKDANEPDEGLIKEVLGCAYPDTPKAQKEAFLTVANSKTEEAYKMEKVKQIYHDLQVLALDDTGEPVTKEQIQAILGVTIDGEMEVMLQNIMNLKNFNVIMPEAKISVAADRTDLIEERNIDGEEYILVRKDGDVSVNGFLLGGTEVVNQKSE